MAYFRSLSNSAGKSLMIIQSQQIHLVLKVAANLREDKKANLAKSRKGIIRKHCSQ